MGPAAGPSRVLPGRLQHGGAALSPRFFSHAIPKRRFFHLEPACLEAV